uniref:CYP734A50 n=1 Tax=Primula forbesii TaxID=175067 RepID=A0A1B2LPH3_9ERIC|nr:CYP734A50 [Primula forbesii]
MERESMLWFFLVCVIIYMVFYFLMRAGDYIWWRPKRIEVHFSKQGIRGPKYHFLLGNTKELLGFMVKAASQSLPLSHHTSLPRVLPFYHQWQKLYGRTFLVWFGPTARLTVSDPILIKDILINRSELFEKVESPPHVRKLEGDGLVTLQGEKWAHHRKIITPSFYMDNLELMVPIMGKSMRKMVDDWFKMSKGSKIEIDVSRWFQELTEEIITHTFFGRSYEEGKKIFELHSRNMIYAIGSYNKIIIPGYRFLPIKQNRQFRKLDREIGTSLKKIIDHRLKDYNNSGVRSAKYPNDLLELMIQASIKSEHTKEMSTWGVSASQSPSAFFITASDIIEECKTMLFAGKYTTSSLMTWTIVLLAMHPQWQELAREEVLRNCGDHDIPTKGHVAKLKTLSMILKESLRLYPPAVALLRRAKCDMELGGCTILRRTELMLPILAVHHAPVIWGQDATEFNPARFSRGVSHAAKHLTAFMPFGLGARRCIGENLAMLQTKLAIAMILQQFSFVLAPSYQHAPTVVMLLDPQYGAPITFHTL